MKNSLKISITFVIAFWVITIFAQTGEKFENPVLFTDRDYCISGDTLWFKVWLPKTGVNLGNVVRVQLDNKRSNLISEVAVKSLNGWAEGFIHIPDSLSTGQYFVTAYLNALRKSTDLQLESKSLLVYNRFSENISEIEIHESDEIQQNSRIEMVLSTDKEHYSPREEVIVKIDWDKNTVFKKAVIKATLVDPLASEISGNRKFKMESCNPSIPGFSENNGLVLSGKVADISGIPVSNVLVTLSAGNNQAWFDYYFVGESDDFHFFLKDAYGNTDVVFQVISNSKTEYSIQLENNHLRRKDLITGRKFLKPEQVEFINTAVNASYAHRLFNSPGSVQNQFFEIPARFSMPFYGNPTLRIVPDEFIDLPDFREIARELLPGFQYRIKNGEIIFRMINHQQKVMFEEEPMRLINGIPVFKNELFAGLKSTDISYIDLVQNERIFGDLILKGVLEVSLKDKSNFWIAKQPNIFQLNVNFLQPGKKACHFVQQNTNKNHPDMRQVYFWELLDTESVKDFSFILSDRKGTVEISIEGFTEENEFFKVSKTIGVK
ncbi:MAG: hypothetical protein EP310_08130 [Bacteroidetes bacterium]|nr:MAG: hypothetical protein EP310_08130 [Bacteroidota bacterium]